MTLMNRRSMLSGVLATASILNMKVARAASGATSLVRVASNLGDPYAEAYFGKDGGFFDKAGLTNIDYQIIAQGGTMAAAVLGGTLDIAITTPITIANGHLRNLPLTILAAGNVSTTRSTSSPIYVSRTSSIRMPKDLIGKRIGLNGLRALSEVALDTWLLKNGIDAEKVHLTEITFNEMGAAVARGVIDAAMIAEPAGSVALKTNDLRVLADPYQAISKRTLVSCWFTTIAYARANPDIVKRFTSAIYATARWANTHHNETAAILEKYAKVDPESVRMMIRAEYAESFNSDDLQPELDAANAVGVLSQPVHVSDIVYHF